jgi:hypothetical protein
MVMISLNARRVGNTLQCMACANEIYPRSRWQQVAHLNRQKVGMDPQLFQRREARSAWRAHEVALHLARGAVSEMATFAASGLKKDDGIKVVPPAVKAAAGSFGGVMEACFLQPIDTIKTRLQLDQTGKYKGIANCGQTVMKEEGVRALWKGLTPFATHLTFKYALRMVRRPHTPPAPTSPHDTPRHAMPPDAEAVACTIS